MEKPHQTEPRAVRVAREHVQAFTRRDYEKSAAMLAKDVQFTVMTTTPRMPALNGGFVEFMNGIRAFGDAIVPGSVRVIDALGDENRALFVFSYEAPWGEGGATLRFVRAAHYFLNDDGKIKVELVVFFPWATV